MVAEVSTEDVKWRCTACGDEMPIKFIKTHPLLCFLIERLMAHRVEQLMVEIEEQP
jgi:hypothetical protein